MRNYLTILRLLRSICVGACLLWTVPAYAVDTLQVTTPDPILEEWRWTEFGTSSGLAGKVYGMVEDRDGNIWFATNKGAQKYDGYQWTTYTQENGLLNDTVGSVIQTRDGAMWSGTGSRRASDTPAVISRMVVSSETGESKWSHYRFEDFVSVDGLFEARDGTVWVDLNGGEDPTDADKRRFLNGKWRRRL